MSPVRLKPILGFSPESYLPLLLGLLLLGALFMLLVFPGIRNHGSVVTLRSTPPVAEVVVDGIRVGATPVTTFVEAGEREIAVSYPGFEEEVLTVDIPGRRFGSLLFPSRRAFEVRLAPLAPGRLAEARSGEFARWALTGAGSAAFPTPPVIAETARALALFPEESQSRRALSELLIQGHHQVATPSQLKDLTRGTLIARGEGAVTPLGLGRSVLEIIQYTRTSQDAAALLAILDRGMPSSLMEEFREAPWFADTLEGRTGENVAAGRAATGTSRSAAGASELPAEVTVEGMSFLGLPPEAAVQGVLMLDREVTRADYAGFLRDVPLWRPENRSTLAEAGQANADYLADWGGAGVPEEPVRFVSWYAADAFARWLDGRFSVTYPALSREYEVRLPRSVEWRAVALSEPAPGEDGEPFERITFESLGETPLAVAGNRMSVHGFYDIFGNLWEWQQDWYAPAPEAAVLHGAPRTGAERVVLGGSFANSRRELSASETGSQPAEWASAYLGFRLVIAPREAE